MPQIHPRPISLKSLRSNKNPWPKSEDPLEVKPAPIRREPRNKERKKKRKNS